MPHLVLDYTDNLAGFNPSQALAALNGALIGSGHFDAIDIKSRAVKLDTHLVGDGMRACGFVHARLSILSGRPVQAKREISDALLQALSNKVGPWPQGVHVQLCVEVLEIERESYAKAVVDGGGARAA